MKSKPTRRGRKRSQKRSSVDHQSVSPQKPRTGLQSTALRAVEQYDNHAGIRNALRELARTRGNYAGIPLPLDGENLVIEPSYVYAGLAELNAKPTPAKEEGCYYRVRNEFWSVWRRSTVIVLEKDGVITYGLKPRVHHLYYDMHSVGCADAWGIEQESNAVMSFGELVTHRQFKQYMLTGMFSERSERSGIIYLFRRLKPTVAISPRSGTGDDSVRCIGTLCLHPIGYYAGSWAGAMCPTDDVIAHLMLMRGDEHMFWKRSNQHAPHLPEAGL